MLTHLMVLIMDPANAQGNWKTAYIASKRGQYAQFVPWGTLRMAGIQRYYPGAQLTRTSERANIQLHKTHKHLQCVSGRACGPASRHFEWLHQVLAQ
jgi:hypothetical protein